MKIINEPRSRLIAVMWLLTVHSFFIGLGLIIQHPDIMKFFGFDKCMESFFPAQGGVFHIVMSFGYLMAAIDLDRYFSLALFSIIVKLCATIFLFTYYFFVAPIWMVFASGIQDGILFILVLYSFTSYNKWKKENITKGGVA
mgnify:CR=1 FL=1